MKEEVIVLISFFLEWTLAYEGILNCSDVGPFAIVSTEELTVTTPLPLIKLRTGPDCSPIIDDLEGEELLLLIPYQNWTCNVNVVSEQLEKLALRRKDITRIYLLLVNESLRASYSKLYFIRVAENCYWDKFCVQTLSQNADSSYCALQTKAAESTIISKAPATMSKQPTTPTISDANLSAEEEVSRVTLLLIALGISSVILFVWIGGGILYERKGRAYLLARKKRRQQLEAVIGEYSQDTLEQEESV